jgi:myo-inositol 2-dehydrogenase/D-chiro-inositol 1-dehydrogenase
MLTSVSPPSRKPLVSLASQQTGRPTYHESIEGARRMKSSEGALSRREMLATSGVLGAGLVGNFSVLRANTKGNDLIKVGLIGCGGRGSGAADQTLSVPDSNVKLVAAADAFENRMKGSLRGLKAKHGDKVDVPPERQFAGLDGYKKVIELCDLVVLATPPGFRPVHFDAAVKAGKNVFMEKPVCVDAAGARQVLETAKQADAKKLKVVVGLQRRYQESYIETLKRLRDGAIGDVVSANVYWNGGGIWFRDRESDMTEMQYQVHNWYHFCWLSGDHICEQHVHNLDVANWFLDAVPESAFGFGGRQVRVPGKSSEIYDHHAVVYHYPNGIVVNSQCRQFPGVNRVTEEFVGTKGRLTAGRIVDLKGNTVWQHRGRRGLDPYQVEHNELHAAIREDKPLNNASYGATSSFTAVLGRYATYTGKEWKFADALKLNHHTMPADPIDWNTKPPTHPDRDGNYTLPQPGVYSIG